MSYADNIRMHQHVVQEHVNGRLNDNKPLSPSFYPPSSYWSSSEKDLFFHGLCIYSRHRPDLIAKDIKTKNTFDVCMYLDTLEAAALQQSAPEIRSSLEPAMEVSERWILREEAIATTLVDVDSFAWNTKNEKSDSPCVPSDSSDEESTLEQNEGYAHVGHLDSTCLLVLDSIIRESEELDLGEIVESSIPACSRVHETSPDGQIALGAVCEGAHRMPMKQFVPVATELSGENGEDRNQILSHEMRRRLKKRLYMRRKRAELAGRAIVVDAIKLRPGRRKKLQMPSNPGLTAYKTKTGENEPTNLLSVPDIINPRTGRSVSVDTNEDDEKFLHESRSQGGATKSYRVRKLFQKHGVDAQALVDMDLNFFHLSSLARLLRLYGSTRDFPIDVDHARISADAIGLLVRITRGFLSDIVRRAIITKEQEIRLKRELKVWKYDRDEITAENVTESLNSMGLRHLNKESYFTQFLGQDGIGQDTSTTQHSAVSEEERWSSEDFNEFADTEVFKFSLPESVLPCSFPTYRRQFSVDDLGAEVVDENNLEKQLEEDAALDIEDKKGSEEFERLLWQWDEQFTGTA